MKVTTGDEIKCSGVTLEVTEDYYPDGSFDALVVKLKSKSKNCGSLGRYIEQDRYYHFQKHEGKDVWEVPFSGTEAFHNEGRSSSQVLLYWWKDTGFDLELDT